MRFRQEESCLACTLLMGFGFRGRDCIYLYGKLATMLSPVTWKLPGRLIVAIWVAFGTDIQRQYLKKKFLDDERMRSDSIAALRNSTIHCQLINANMEGRRLG